MLTSPREKNKSKFPYFSPWASQRTGAVPYFRLSLSNFGGRGRKATARNTSWFLGYSSAGQTTWVPEVFFSFAEIQFGGDVSRSALPIRLWPRFEATSGEARGSLWRLDRNRKPRMKSLCHPGNVQTELTHGTSRFLGVHLQNQKQRAMFIAMNNNIGHILGFPVLRLKNQKNLVQRNKQRHKKV